MNKPRYIPAVGNSRPLPVLGGPPQHYPTGKPPEGSLPKQPGLPGLVPPDGGEFVDEWGQRWRPGYHEEKR